MATVNPVAASSNDAQSVGLTTEITIKLTPFDRREYRKLIEARSGTIRQVVSKLKPALGLTTAIDAGCGVGFFAQTLRESGLNTCGFDGRAENVAEARKRFRGIPFEEGDIEDPAITSLGQFDLVLCFGLLYHLENPLLAIRNLRALTGKCLLVESMCIPGDKPAMLLREEARQDDQSLTDMACYPSEGSLVKMLYRAGFTAVYRTVPLPEHDDFKETPERARRRTVLLASTLPVDIAGFRLCLEPREKQDPWSKDTLRRGSVLRRVGRFLTSSNYTKYVALAHRCRRVFPGVPIPLRLPFGAWWLAEKSALDHQLIYESFESAEIQFVGKLLRPGMTVVDIGAHHGLYALLMSKCVGEKGLVVAFEPSPRECRRLEKHIYVNRCSNIWLEKCALADALGEADLFLGDGFHDWCNSLRSAATSDVWQTIRVRVRRLDDVFKDLGVADVDFIKMDAEGAELSVLQGALKLLGQCPRPAILAEVQDVRTRPWGYPAREIIRFLSQMNYRWFALSSDGSLLPVSTEKQEYDANLVALPDERVEEFQELLAGGSPVRWVKRKS